MKTQKRFLLILVCLLSAMVVSAQRIEFTTDDFGFAILSQEDKTCEVLYIRGQEPSMVIPEKVEYEGAEYSVTSIRDRAFADCSRLETLVLPNSVTQMGDGVFDNCDNLTQPVYNDHIFARLPTSFEGSFAIPEGIETIAGGACWRCAGLTSVTIPNSVTSIRVAAFERCSGLTSANIPSSVTTLERWAFYGCSSLTSIVIPNTITSIEESTFYGCSGLTSITIPNSVTNIGVGAFGGCI